MGLCGDDPVNSCRPGDRPRDSLFVAARCHAILLKPPLRIRDGLANNSVVSFATPILLRIQYGFSTIAWQRAANSSIAWQRAAT
eukprot:1597545-Pyramimonas_sp.AAC.1